ncbi:class I SAM-dependent DNA methyltransferase [Thermococcus barophilus]|uniref:site-specific DNA-methyltransferase (adenine-specific) n=1 Tax=Thermococcus barophilus TaxID=55802 RepID=A0A0S1XE59_THEBA|nr:type I restriction-modification system subunit M [Thermococcus barophilus]ALM76055.1 type I restriction enzyme Methylation protein [Thermococcus barophilus]
MKTLDDFIKTPSKKENPAHEVIKMKKKSKTPKKEMVKDEHYYELEPELERRLWSAADKLRKKVEVHEYKYIVLGLIFLRYLSHAFNERREELKEEYKDNPFLEKILEDPDYYREAGVFYLPKETRWEYLLKNANQPNIGELIDNAIETLEKMYPKELGGVIPKKYAEINLDPNDLAYLLNLFTDIDFERGKRGRDLFGRIYEYFLGKFAQVEGKNGGEFYTPRSLTKLIIEALDVKEGRIFDPACGSGGFFVAALEREGIDKTKLAIYGQESKEGPWKICKMNLAIRGAEGDIRLGDSYHDDKFLHMRFDFVVSNPPFNDSKWGADRISPDDPRIKLVSDNNETLIPPDNNANYMWILHFIYHLAPNGKAGFVMANGALSAGGVEGKIRQRLIEKDLIYAIVAAPPKLFYNVSLPVSLWFARKKKPEHMKGKVLFINAKNLYKQVSRRQNVMTDEHIHKIVEKFRLFEEGRLDEIDEIGFAKVATIEEIAKNNYVLTPGRYVGVKLEFDDPRTFEEKMKEYSEEMAKLLKEEEELTAKVREVFEALGWRL